MCDPDCRKRFVKMEVELASIVTDVKWLKKILTIILVMIAGLLGVDISGVI